MAAQRQSDRWLTFHVEQSFAEAEAAKERVQHRLRRTDTKQAGKRLSCHSQFFRHQQGIRLGGGQQALGRQPTLILLMPFETDRIFPRKQRRRPLRHGMP